jgi:uncharacterized membrane protein HdeD (DUF308 family)
MKQTANALTWKGILSLVIGVIAVAWPGITVGAFVLLFAVYAFLMAGMGAASLFASRSAGMAAWSVLVVIVDLAAGVIALAWPDITVLAAAVLIAVWAFGSGLAELAAAFIRGESFAERSLLGLTGLVSIGLGVVFVSRPDIGVLTAAEVYGLFSILSGISALVLAANIRQIGGSSKLAV